MAEWKEPKVDYTAKDQVKPSIFNTLGENERYLKEVKITIGQVQNAVVTSVESSIRENLSANESIKTAFGKIRKVFADLKSLAFADTVSASKVTGLAKVATSGDYNDLSNKPKIETVTFKRVVCWMNSWYPEIEKGIYLAFLRFRNLGGLTNVTCFGPISTGITDNGTFSARSEIFTSGGDRCYLSITYNNSKGAYFELKTDKDDYDGSAELVLYKIWDLPAVDDKFEGEIL